LDYVSVHNYWLPRGNELLQYDYMTAITKSEMPDTYIKIVTESLKKQGMDRLKIAFDEWNLRAWHHPGFPRNQVENYKDPEILRLVKERVDGNDLNSQYTMADALFSASFLNACLRNSENVTMANIAPLVNTRGPLFVHSKGIVKRPHYYTIAMYTNKLEKQVSEIEITADKFVNDSDTVNVVDAIVTVNKTGKNRVIALVNRHPFEDVNCTIQIGDRILNGTFDATILTDNINEYNDIEHPYSIIPVEMQLAFKMGVTTLPPRSLIVVNVKD